MENLMIELKNINKNLAKKQILNNINLEFCSGTGYLLKGHNGSGKTMLLRLISGLIKPSEGTVFQTKDYKYGVIIENPTFLENETALYNLTFLASINNDIGEKEIISTLEEFNLYKHRNEKVKSFSLGMKQRLALCQAFMENPDVLLLDEPFNALDDENIEILNNKLRDLKNKGKLIIIAAHGYNTEGQTIFENVVRLNNGSVTEIDIIL